MKAKNWLICWILIVAICLCFIGYWVVRVDPYFHYHAPITNEYYYSLNNERSQNDGISKYFSYDAMITGSSMTQNFKTSEMDEIFGCDSVKVPFAGATFKEVNDNVVKALESNDNLRIVVRCLDMSHLLDEWDCMRTDLGVFPTYLYDNNYLNDAGYLFNREIVFGRIYQMIKNKRSTDWEPGIDSFDDYTYWQNRYVCGSESVMSEAIKVTHVEQSHLTNSEKETIKTNIEKNVINVADQNPDVTFYYFYSPYSVVKWNEWREGGKLLKYLEAEKYTTELILQHDNIRLFSFNNRTDITTDLNNYKDSIHYATWINSLMLKWMHNGDYELTKDNFEDYSEKEYDFYTTYDYESVNGQIDYESDFYAAALCNEELTGAKPIDIFNNKSVNVEIANAELVQTSDGKNVLECDSYIGKKNSEELGEYLYDTEYVGAKLTVNLDAGYKYLVYDSKRIEKYGSFAVVVYDSNGNIINKKIVICNDIDTDVHKNVIDLSNAKGDVTIIFHGGFFGPTDSNQLKVQYSNVYLY